MLLKEDIIKSISEMEISELLLVRNMIQNIKKTRLHKEPLPKKNAGALKTRSALKGVQLSDDIKAMREDRN